MAINFISRKRAIHPAPEFVKKGLATHVLNVGSLCNHGCCYCYTPTMERLRPERYEGIGGTSYEAFAQGNMTLDLGTPALVAAEAPGLKPDDTVFMCSTTDAWCPGAMQHGLGRATLGALLKNSACGVRILTKNAGVVSDLDIMAKYPGRVELALSLTAPPAKAQLLNTLEPYASALPYRLDALHAAHDLGIPVFGMLCPCLPGIADGFDDLVALFNELKPLKPEHIWSEPVNPRGPALPKCEKALRQAGYSSIADQVGAIRNRKAFQAYAHAFIDTATAAANSVGMGHLLSILMYEDGLDFTGDGSRVIWLKK